MINVQVSLEYETSEIDEKAVIDKTKSICKQLGLQNIFVDVAVLNDNGIIAANNEFLKHDHVTDVISFDLSDETEDQRTFELLVNGELASREAAQRGHSSFAELMLYITHGLLHNLGYEDSNERLAAKMHEKEDELLENEGFGSIFEKR